MNLALELLLLLVTILYSYVEALVSLFTPRRRKSVAGEVVLVTGAGHGIGRLTAHEFAKRRSKLGLWDINKVEETAAECRKHGATVHAFVVDCSNRQEIYNSVNQITKALLPSMMKRNYGHIVTVASVCGHVVIPYFIPYCSSKFDALGFHRALTEELAVLGKTDIKTLCLCPVFVNTGFTKNPSTGFLPERALAAINRVQDVQFESVVGHKTKMK